MSFHPCENPRTGTRGPSKSFVSYQRKGLALHPIKSGSLAPQPHSRIDALGLNSLNTESFIAIPILCIAIDIFSN